MIVASARCQDVRDGPFPFPDERHKLENDATVMLDLIDQTEIHHHLHDTHTRMKRRTDLHSFTLG